MALDRVDEGWWTSREWIWKPVSGVFRWELIGYWLKSVQTRNQLAGKDNDEKKRKKSRKVKLIQQAVDG